MKAINQWLLSSPIYWILLIISIAIIIIYYVYGSKILGWFGEHWTKSELKKLPKDKYIILNDIFININGFTHQIDHVIVSCYGIFSIETKQYNGYITGSKYDKNWVRHINSKVLYYVNPIRQNYGHVKALSELLKLDEKKIFNIVCIPSNAKLKIEHNGELVRNTTIVSKILTYQDIIIDNINEIADIIKKNNIKDKVMKKEHIHNIRTNIANKDYTKCPKCGGNLIERNGKYGEFIGCSNYPKCKYTQKK